MIVCSFDIDGTQYDYTDVKQDTHALQLKNTLETMRNEQKLFLVHNTGRPFPWICHGDINERYLNPIIAQADLIISHSGTEMFCPDNPSLPQSWNNKILQVTSVEAVQELRNLLSQRFNLHPESFDCRYKTSIIVSPEQHAQACLQAQALLDQKLPGQFDLVFWNNRSVDFTPRGINKKTALEHALAVNGLESLPLYVAGDSANDIPMFDIAQAQKIIVGNATKELRQHAQNSSNIYMAADNDRSASGVLAGLMHFGVLAPEQTPVRLNNPSTNPSTLKP